MKLLAFWRTDWTWPNTISMAWGHSKSFPHFLKIPVYIFMVFLLVQFPFCSQLYSKSVVKIKISQKFRNFAKYLRVIERMVNFVCLPSFCITSFLLKHSQGPGASHILVIILSMRLLSMPNLPVTVTQSSVSSARIPCRIVVENNVQYIIECTRIS